MRIERRRKIGQLNREWSAAIFAADNWTCAFEREQPLVAPLVVDGEVVYLAFQPCGRRAQWACHIIRRSQAPAVRFETWNGLAGCDECHRRYDSHTDKTVRVPIERARAAYILALKACAPGSIPLRYNPDAVA